MKTKYIFFAVSFLISNLTFILNAQQSIFTKVYYDLSDSAQAYSIVKTFDNNFIIVGEKDLEGLVLKIDKAGNIIWNKKIGSDNNTYFNNIIATNDSCFVIAGQCKNETNSTLDIFYVKMNSNGDTLWSKSIDMGNSEYISSLQQTNDNGYIFTGYTEQSITTPYTNIAIVKLDFAGNISWTKKIICGNNKNYAYSIKQTPDSGYIVIGQIENKIGSTFDIRTCLIKLSSNGTVSWAKNNNPLSQYSYIEGYDVIVTKNGLICYLELNNLNGIVIIKTDFFGNILWSNNYSLSSSSSGIVSNYSIPKLNCSTDGGYVFAVSEWDFGRISKIDSLGNIIWSQGTELITTDVIEASDGGFLVVGNGPLGGVKSPPTFNPQIGIIKTDSLGNSSNCVFQRWVTTNPYSINLVPVSFTSATGGTMNLLHPIIVNDPFLIDTGCVARTGGIEESISNESGLIVYPNPANGIFQIKFKQDEPIFNLEVFNTIGEKVYQSSDPAIFQSTLDLSFVPEGIYYLQVVSDKKIYSQKIIICY